MCTGRFASFAAAIVVGGGTLLAASAANAAVPVGDYVTFEQGDSPFTLQIGGVTSKIYNAVLPNSMAPAALTPDALMTLQIEVENPNNLSWNMTVNGTTIMSFTHSRDRFGAIQEVFPASLLHVGANNVTVRVVSGQGRLRVSDFALHFQSLAGNP